MIFSPLPTDKEQTIDFTLPFPTTQAIYDNLTFTVDRVPFGVKRQPEPATELR